MKRSLYETMRVAIEYIREHAAEHPDTQTVAKAVGLSSSRFEHAFNEWVGTTPKRFLSHITKERAKSFLVGQNVLKTAHASGLSGPGRLHELMVTYEAVSPGEFKSGQIDIQYGIHDSPFGWCVIGITKRGICYLSFIDSSSRANAERLIKETWPKAQLSFEPKITSFYIKRIFNHSNSKKPFHLLLKGTNLQVKVWEALLKIPQGEVTSYSVIARAAGFPKAVRAVGTACGKNNIAFLIPCHRVLTSDGKIGGYRWGIERKETVLAWEAIHNRN